MKHPLAAAVLVALVAACHGGTSGRPADPIPEIPDSQQRAINRIGFGPQWPFTTGTGTLGCTSGAVVFRAAGVTYAVNDAARSRGFTSADSLRQVQASGLPGNPLGRLKQDERMKIFAATNACAGEARNQMGGTSSCRKTIRETHDISDDELKQIEAEGVERLWPPLTPRRMSLDPLITAGLKLCRR